jgi:hypothetical protein
MARRKQETGGIYVDRILKGAKPAEAQVCSAVAIEPESVRTEARYFSVYIGATFCDIGATSRGEPSLAW